MTAAWREGLRSTPPEELLRRAATRRKIAQAMEDRGQPGAAAWQRRRADEEVAAAQ
jgi:hypothetical protein